MTQLSLVPNLNHPVVECYNLNIPIDHSENWVENTGYRTTNGYKRYLIDTVRPETQLWIDNLVKTKIYPLIFSHPCFRNTWPVLPKTMIDNTWIQINKFKDEIGWYQPLHEDPKVFLLSGIIHMQDCDQGTAFHDDYKEIRYTAPTKKLSGAFWANTQYSHHSVQTVTKERSGYLILAVWKNFEPLSFNYPNTDWYHLLGEQ